jgi:hypothetical protein
MLFSGSGRGSLRLIILDLPILAALAFVAIQAGPVYLRNYHLANYIRQLADQAGARRVPADAILASVVAQARALNLPVARKNVRVGTDGSRLTIQLDDEVPIDLEVYTWVLHFEPSAEGQVL